MTKTFIYHVAGEDFTDSEAWGTAWREARTTAEVNHLPIFRTVIKGETVKEEHYTTAGAFINNEYYEEKYLKVF